MGEVYVEIPLKGDATVWFPGWRDAGEAVVRGLVGERGRCRFGRFASVGGGGSLPGWRVARSVAVRAIEVLLVSCGADAVHVRFETRPKPGRCDTRCRGARWFDCECPCQGEYHGREYVPSRGGRTFLVGETTLLVLAESAWVRRVYRTLDEARR